MRMSLFLLKEPIFPFISLCDPHYDQSHVHNMTQAIIFIIGVTKSNIININVFVLMAKAATPQGLQ